MTLRLSDVQRDTIANRALNELMRHYIVTEEKRGLVLTKKVGDMKLFCMTSTTCINWISSIISRW
jgi:hypothetical protein